MIENAKIALSPKELELVSNTDWILTKHTIINKVYALFGTIAADMQLTIHNCDLPQEVKKTTPKIAKGENYQLLPYVMLDYPRYFIAKDTMAIRIFFWWGNSISIHLLLSGKYKENTAKKLESNFSLLQQNDYSLCVADNPWQHHFGTDNYIAFKNYTSEEFSNTLYRESFIKIGKEIPLSQWNDIPEFLITSFIEMIAMIN
jgi:hypothetical protein